MAVVVAASIFCIFSLIIFFLNSVQASRGQEEEFRPRVKKPRSTLGSLGRRVRPAGGYRPG